MGIKKDISEHSFYNIFKGWITSLIVGIPFLFMTFALPFTWGDIVLSYNPEWYVRCGMAGIGILGMLAPNKLPSIILEGWDFAKYMLKREK